MKFLGDYRRPVSDKQDSLIKCYGVNLKIQSHRTEAEIMSNVSVLGLGKMGTALAKSLLASGRSVTVWNRSANKSQPFIDTGEGPG